MKEGTEIVSNIQNYPNRKFKLISKVGEGDSGCLYFAQAKFWGENSNKEFVLKFYPQNEIKEQEYNFIIQLIGQQNSNDDEGFPYNLIRIFDIFQYKDQWVTVTEKGEFDLQSYLKKNRQQLTNMQILIIQIWLTMPIYFLQQNGLILRDIKTQHFLKVRDQFKLNYGLASKKGSVTDFNITKDLEKLLFSAPELIENINNFTDKVDVWSLGCVFYDIFSQNPLFDSNFEQVKKQILNHKNNKKFIYDKIEQLNCDIPIKNLIKQMLQFEQTKRCNIYYVIGWLYENLPQEIKLKSQLYQEYTKILKSQDDKIRQLQNSNEELRQQQKSFQNFNNQSLDQMQGQNNSNQQQDENYCLLKQELDQQFLIQQKQNEQMTENFQKIQQYFQLNQNKQFQQTQILTNQSDSNSINWFSVELQKINQRIDNELQNKNYQSKNQDQQQQVEFYQQMKDFVNEINQEFQENIKQNFNDFQLQIQQKVNIQEIQELKAQNEENKKQIKQLQSLIEKNSQFQQQEQLEAQTYQEFLVRKLNSTNQDYQQQKQQIQTKDLEIQSLNKKLDEMQNILNVRENESLQYNQQVKTLIKQNETIQQKFEINTKEKDQAILNLYTQSQNNQKLQQENQITVNQLQDLRNLLKNQQNQLEEILIQKFQIECELKNKNTCLQETHDKELQLQKSYIQQHQKKNKEQNDQVKQLMKELNEAKELSNVLNRLVKVVSKLNADDKNRFIQENQDKWGELYDLMNVN